MSYQLVHVETRSRYYIYLEYGDGTRGEVNLTPFAGLSAYRTWNAPSEFEKVHI